MRDGEPECFAISAWDNMTNVKGYVQPKTNEQPMTNIREFSKSET